MAYAFSMGLPLFVFYVIGVPAAVLAILCKNEATVRLLVHTFEESGMSTAARSRSTDKPTHKSRQSAVLDRERMMQIDDTDGDERAARALASLDPETQRYHTNYSYLALLPNGL